MAAKDNLNPQLFHGTTAWLNDGDIINPTSYGPEDDEPVPVAFASTKLNHAAQYASDALDGGNPKVRKPQGQLFAPVYEVEHVTGPVEDDSYKYPSAYVRDSGGFRVKGVVDYVGSGFKRLGTISTSTKKEE